MHAESSIVDLALLARLGCWLPEAVPWLTGLEAWLASLQDWLAGLEEWLAGLAA